MNDVAILTADETPREWTVTATTEWDTITSGVYPTSDWEGFYDGTTTLVVNGADHQVPRVQCRRAA